MTTRTIRFQLAAICTLAATFAAGNASAAMIVNEWRFDGYVRNSGGDGPTGGVEHHFTNTPFDASDNLVNLSDTDALPLNVFNDTPAHRAQVVESGQRFTMWEKAIPAQLFFGNPVDTTLDPPLANIEWEVELFLSQLPVGQKLIIEDIRFEDGSIPSESNWPSPVFESISDNRGSADDPITVLVRVDAGLLSDGFGMEYGKLHLYWDTMDIPTVPEPTTGMLMLLGCAAVGLVRRRA